MNDEKCLAYAYIEINGDVEISIIRDIFNIEPMKVYIKGSIGRFGGTIDQNSISFSTSKISTPYSYEIINHLINIVPLDKVRSNLSESRNISIQVVAVFNYKGSRPAISLETGQINWLSAIKSSFSVSMYEDLD